MTRDEALKELEKSPVYPTLGIEQQALKYPIHDYTEYKTDEKLWEFLCKMVKYGRKIGLFNERT